MLKTMVFIDYQNFNITRKKYARSKGKRIVNIDYNKFPKELNKRVKLDTTLVKTYLFAYKPCDQLMVLPRYQKYYNWLTSISPMYYLEVIEGSQEIRSISKDVKININDKSTYTTTEKGTDVNLAVTMLSKAYSNAFDVAILVSGDTDYIPVVEVLHQLGKIVVIASIDGQNVSKYSTLMDAHIIIDDNMLNACSLLRKQPTIRTKTATSDVVEAVDEVIDEDVDEE